ncbi:MAG TPA: twin-arginine translocation pathway signal [Mycobacterium sp.]|nr:twin-arginine translocation pathway signal [Mycobacterium sp.]
MTVDQDRRVDDADDADDLGVGGADSDDKLLDEQRAGKRRMRVNIRWPRVSGSWIRPWLHRWRLIVLVLAVVAAVGLAGGLFFFQYRPDQQTDNAAAHAAITAASEGAVAILSYTPAGVDHDLAVAQSYLTGEFGRYYREFGQRYVAPAVRQQDVKASAAVLRAAVSELHPDSAVVLLFIHQTTTSKDKPKPVLTSSNVRATLTKISRSWLISDFEPI